MRWCDRCNKSHRFYSRPWIHCFGIAAKDCNLYANDEKIKKAYAGEYSPFLDYSSFKSFVDEFEEHFCVGITVRGHA